SRLRLIGPRVRSRVGQPAAPAPDWSAASEMLTGAVNGTVYVLSLMTAVAVPVATSCPLTSEILWIVGIMLMLLVFGAACAAGPPIANNIVSINSSAMPRCPATRTMGPPILRADDRYDICDLLFVLRGDVARCYESAWWDKA